MAHVDRQPECEMSSNPERSSLLPPYAAPVASDFERPRAANAGLSTPFVPPSLRYAEPVSEAQAEAFDTMPAATDEALELPWIEAFAEDPTSALDTSTEDSANAFGFAGDGSANALEAAASHEQPSEAAAAAESAPEPAATDDAWAIADVSEHIARLAEELAAASKEPVSAPTPMPPMPAVSHTPWHDDDAWMDIMPALPNSGARDMAAETEWARAFGEPPAPMTPPPLPTGDQQAAAAALESIARRLRSGELQVPGFVADRGDAAALAAALASLLGARP
jgi:hypothetical protein